MTAAAARNRAALGTAEGSVGGLDVEQVARHEPAHATIFLAGGATFDTIHVGRAANGHWSGRVTDITGAYPVHLVGLVAGAVADAVPAHEFTATAKRLLAGDYRGAVGMVIQHLTTSACCSADLADAQKLATEIDWGRSIAYDVAGTALLNLYGHHERWNALTEAILETASAPRMSSGSSHVDGASARRVWRRCAGPPNLAWFGTAGGRARIAVDGLAEHLVYERGRAGGRTRGGRR